MRALWIPLAASLVAGCLDPRADGSLVPRTVATDPDLPSFALEDGARIHLRTYGDPSRPALILVHGGPGGDVRGMLPLAALSDRYHVIAYDHRGSGLSERVPEETLTLWQVLADLQFVADAFSPDRPVTLVGHSWGGAVAAGLLDRAGLRVARAVLIDPSPLSGPIASLEPALPAFGTRPVDRQLLVDLIASADDEELRDFRMLDEALAEGAREIWRPGATAAMRISTGMAEHGFRLALHAGEQPSEVLFIIPDGETPFGAGLQSLQRPAFLRSRLVTIPETDHISILRSPLLIAELRRSLPEYAP
jgi:pimeloyl-ACP methyl ester carboxylesterase